MKSGDILMVSMADGGASGPDAEPGSPEVGPGPQQSQQPEQPFDPPGGEGSGQKSESSGSGCTSMGCVGCGCLTVLGLMALAVAGGGWALWTIPDRAGADDWEGVFEMAEGAQQAVAAAEGEPEAMDGPDSDQQVADGAAQLDRYFETLEETEVTDRDVRRVTDRLESWEQTEVVTDFYETLEALDEAGDDDSALQQLNNLRHLTRLVFRVRDLGEEYHEDVAPELGDEYRQLAALVRISQLGSSGDHEPFEQAVADALVDDHDEYRDDYLEARRLMKELRDEELDADELSPEQQQRLAEAWGDQIVMITGGLNRESLEVWQGMDDDERRAVVDQLDAEHNWVARYTSLMFQAGDEEPPHPYVWLLGM